jgi:diphthamide synthase (EF-2-diphthine--ammonia ligase)
MAAARDSGGRVTDHEKVAMDRIGRVDLALVAVSAEYLNSSTVGQALETKARQQLGTVVAVARLIETAPGGG